MYVNDLVVKRSVHNVSGFANNAKFVNTV